MAARLRLRFDPSCSLGEEFCGIQQWWFALSPHMTCIADVLSGIVSMFHLQRSCPNGIVLMMDDFALPPPESISLLNDKELISVKPLEHRLVNGAAVGLLREHGETQVLRKIEEFEKESGGYKSEDEDLNVSNDLSLELTPPLARARKLPLPKSLKRKKSGEKESKGKAKKLRTRDTAETAVAENGKKKKKKIKSEKKLKRKMKEPEKSSEEENSSSGEDDKESERSEKPVHMSNGVGAVDKDTTENGSLIKRASRSARRKKAKREWLRANKNAKANSSNENEAGNKNTTTTVNESVPCNEPVVVAPGHIRFEPLEESTEVAPLPVMNIGSGIKSKRQGQSWGQNKRRRQEQGWETVEPVQEEPPVEASIDFNDLPLLGGTPEKGDVLAYKIVELSANGTPELSSFRVGEVISYDDNTKLITLNAVAEHPIPKNEEDQFPYPYQEDGSLEVDFVLLQEARILHGQQKNQASNVTESNFGGRAAEIPRWSSEQREEEDNANGKSVPLSKAEKWKVKSMRAAALGPTLARLRANDD